MLKIKIAHLYYDLLNLYGENGNVRALKRFLERQDIKTEIHFLTIGDKIDFKKYDIYYIGMGTENSIVLALKDILKYKEDIEEAINIGKHFIITGNALELFGKYIQTEDKEKLNALDIFPYHAVHEDFRIVGSTVLESKLIKHKIIGFQNRCGQLYGIDKPLFKVIDGVGSNINSKKEGYKFKHFYGTSTLGPLLIRNPHLTNHILKEVVNTKNKDYKFKIYNQIPEIKAYNTYLENFNIEAK